MLGAQPGQGSAVVVAASGQGVGAAGATDGKAPGSKAMARPTAMTAQRMFDRNARHMMRP
jgi:hypothetical protein